MKQNIAETYGLTDQEAAMFAASHRGETYHIEALESIMRKTGITEEEILCCPTLPLNDEPKFACMREGIAPRKLYHNCSGKHLGIIATARELGYPTDTYWEPSHPVQQDILNTLAYMADYPVDQIEIGIDGCGFPIFALPLKNIANAYLKLACPDMISDEATREAVKRMTRYMHASPDSIASHNFICSELLRDSNIVAKGGAKGVYCFSLIRERVAFALKVIDGSETPWPIIVASILEQIGYSNQETIDRLYTVVPKEIKNDNHIVVGERQAAFKL
ncbi:atypical L-asparaginase [Paenibacillus pini JCM 16418]|uniref:Atypical L-asparaginase n=1 Tax=Paenibacillus pini JCM 16418 TaxID=1236976 RepID=W7YFG2_9BACL|nr:atypical L-asparaginase [Paenibacillus pini JCM 16418]